MPGLRFVYLLALVVWLGGLLAQGAVTAPQLFSVLQSRAPDEGRILAGAVFGAILARMHLVAYLCGAVMLVALALMAAIGPRPRPFAPRLAVIAAMLGITLAVAFPIGWRLAAARAQVPGAVQSLPPTDPRRAEFDQMHELSSMLLTVNALAGLALLWWESRERRF